MKPSTGLALAAWTLGAAIACSTMAYLKDEMEEPPCQAYARQAAKRRKLNDAERREVERSCSISRIYQPIKTRDDARVVANKLRAGNKCSKPGPYVAHALNGNGWAVFCPML